MERPGSVNPQIGAHEIWNRSLAEDNKFAMLAWQEHRSDIHADIAFAGVVEFGRVHGFVAGYGEGLHAQHGSTGRVP